MRTAAAAARHEQRGHCGPGHRLVIGAAAATGWQRSGRRSGRHGFLGVAGRCALLRTLLADLLLLLLQLGAEPRLPLLLGQPAAVLGARVAREA